MAQPIIVLVMHGMPPSDFPAEEKREFFSLLSRKPDTDAVKNAAAQTRLNHLDAKMRSWPRTPANDAFHAASYDLARLLSQQLACEVVVGFNEFCAPTVHEAVAKAVKTNPEKIVITTPMVTRGGSHSEQEIPEDLARLRQQFPDVPIVYAWPFDDQAIAEFLARQVKAFL